MLKKIVLSVVWALCDASFHEQYRGADEVCKSSWSPYEQMTFPLDRNRARHHMKTVQYYSNSTIENEESQNFEEETESNTQSYIEQNPSNSQNTSAIFKPPKKKLNDSDNRKLKSALEKFSPAAAAANEVAGDAASSNSDESQTFANFIASKLRLYSNHTKNALQHEMSNLLFQADNVPQTCTDKWESYVFGDKEFLIQNWPVNWENAKIMCRGHHNGTLAILDTKEKAEFVTEALAESQFLIDSIWVGAKRQGADDPLGYRWINGIELRRSASDILRNEGDRDLDQYPAWQNRTHVPVPEGGADCVAVERVFHDHPVFLDLPCELERPFVCEREASVMNAITELKTVRCRTGLYRMYDGRLSWHQAAAYCVLRKMSLANIETMKCLKKLGTTMLKIRPSMENAWVGAKGELGRWQWVDTGASIFQVGPFSDVDEGEWPPMRDRTAIKESGCLQLDRHTAHAPVFMEARCERKMQFICYQGSPALRMATTPPSDDNYYYVLVKQLLYWQHAYENCEKMKGMLATPDTSEVLTQLLLVMGENKEEPVNHIWISGRLNMTKDVSTDAVSYSWTNPFTNKRIPEPKNFGEHPIGIFMPPWLNEDFSTDNPCLNLDRQDHLNGLLYGIPCDTPQYSICMIEKAPSTASKVTDLTPTTSAGTEAA